MTKSIKNKVVVETVIEKSRFICTLIPVKTSEEAEKELALLKKEYWDATHNCSAYIIGWNQETMKCRDDGEPSRTAGVPMLEVLKNNQMTNVLAVVTRYFGGIKLGAGGLVRAYGKSVTNTLPKAQFTTVKKIVDITLNVTYKEFEIIKHYLENNEKNITEINYLENVQIQFETEEFELEKVKCDIIDMFKNNVNINLSDPYLKEVIISMKKEEE